MISTKDLEAYFQNRLSQKIEKVEKKVEKSHNFQNFNNSNFTIQEKQIYNFKIRKKFY